MTRRRDVTPRSGVGAVVALMALTAALAWDAGRGSAGAAGGFTFLNNACARAREVDR